RAKDSRPDSGIFDELAAASVSVPKDTSPSNKAAVSALIDGLAVPNRELRYECLDMLVKRTGKIDLARGFKRYQETQGKFTLAFEEPREGFPEGDSRREQLYQLQK